MDPVCCHIGGRPIFWYGIMVAVGFLACVAHLAARAVRDGRPASFGSDAAFWIMLFGIVGARVAYVIANLGYYAANPAELLRVDQGGLIYYGGFAGAFLAGVIYARIKGVGILELADFIVSALPLGHAFGRVGCFVNACCYGSVTAAPWGVFQHGALRHPVQIYEALFNLALYVSLFIVHRRSRRSGAVLSVYCMAYGAARFAFEFLRGDERLAWHGLTVAQLVSLALMAAGAAVWLRPARASRGE